LREIFAFFEDLGMMRALSTTVEINSSGVTILTTEHRDLLLRNEDFLGVLCGEVLGLEIGG
jgi:hypothetical protein